MRQYKFRAWHKEKKAFIAGFNLINFHDYYTKGLEPELHRYNAEWKLSEVELLQSIGQPDKNGKQIWEGDIMKVRVSTQHGGIHNKTKDFLMVVVWSESECGFQLQEPEGTDMGNYRIHNGNWSVHEIVGNIYEHSQLLKP